jgi:hypothetical protein
VRCREHADLVALSLETMPDWEKGKEKRSQNRLSPMASGQHTRADYSHKPTSPTTTLLCSPVGPALHEIRFDSVVDRSASKLARGRHRR